MSRPPTSPRVNQILTGQADAAAAVADRERARGHHGGALTQRFAASRDGGWAADASRLSPQPPPDDGRRHERGTSPVAPASGERAETRGVRRRRRQSSWAGAGAPGLDAGRCRACWSWLVVALYPLFETFRLSFTNARLGSAAKSSYVGFENYRPLWNDDLSRRALAYGQFTVSSVALETVLGMMIALSSTPTSRAGSRPHRRC